MAAQLILLVDDQPMVLTAIARVLEERGYRVRTAAHGEEALESAEKERPDMVITDIRMPFMDGWTLVRRLRSRADFTLLPVIILTDHNTPESRMQGFRLGADDFVPKTAIVEELEVRIERAMRRSEAIQRTLSLGSGKGRRRPPPDRGTPDADDAPPKPAAAEGKPAPPADDAGFGFNLPPLAVAMGRQKPEPAAPAGPAAPVAGMVGTLDQIGLASILTLLSSGEKTGILALMGESEDHRGHILLRQGQVLRIQVDRAPDLVHADGIAEMMRWPQARFAFTIQDVSADNEVNTPTEHLLMEASRLMDEGGW